MAGSGSHVPTIFCLLNSPLSASRQIDKFKQRSWFKLWIKLVCDKPNYWVDALLLHYVERYLNTITTVLQGIPSFTHSYIQSYFSDFSDGPPCNQNLGCAWDRSYTTYIGNCIFQPRGNKGQLFAVTIQYENQTMESITQKCDGPRLGLRIPEGPHPTAVSGSPWLQSDCH